jgi:hypothetical protein
MVLQKDNPNIVQVSREDGLVKVVNRYNGETKVTGIVTPRIAESGLINKESSLTEPEIIKVESQEELEKKIEAQKNSLIKLDNYKSGDGTNAHPYGYDIARFLRLNPDDEKTLTDAGFNQEDIKKAKDYNSQPMSTMAYAQQYFNDRGWGSALKEPQITATKPLNPTKYKEQVKANEEWRNNINEATDSYIEKYGKSKYAQSASSNAAEFLGMPAFKATQPGGSIKDVNAGDWAWTAITVGSIIIPSVIGGFRALKIKAVEVPTVDKAVNVDVGGAFKPGVKVPEVAIPGKTILSGEWVDVGASELGTTKIKSGDLGAISSDTMRPIGETARTVYPESEGMVKTSKGLEWKEGTPSGEVELTQTIKEFKPAEGNKLSTQEMAEGVIKRNNPMAKNLKAEPYMEARYNPSKTADLIRNSGGANIEGENANYLLNMEKTVDPMSGNATWKIIKAEREVFHTEPGKGGKPLKTLEPGGGTATKAAPTVVTMTRQQYERLYGSKSSLEPIIFVRLPNGMYMPVPASMASVYYSTSSENNPKGKGENQSKVIPDIKTGTETNTKATTDTQPNTNNEKGNETEPNIDVVTNTETAPITSSKTGTKTKIKPAVLTNKKLSEESYKNTEKVPAKAKLPDTKKEEEQTKSVIFPKGSVAWKQGIGWWVWKPPYHPRDRSFVLTRPQGAEIAVDAKTAFGTIQSIGGTGDVNKSFDMGIVDVKVNNAPSRPSKSTGHESIKFKRDTNHTYGGKTEGNRRVGPYYYRNGAVSRTPL